MKPSYYLAAPFQLPRIYGKLTGEFTHFIFWDVIFLEWRYRIYWPAIIKSSNEISDKKSNMDFSHQKQEKAAKNKAMNFE